MQKQSTVYRNLSAWVVLLAMMAPAIYILHFYHNRLQHRQQMWAQVKEKTLHTVTLDSAQIRWTKKNRELILNGEYFDIATIKYKNGKAYITGVFDHEETKMHKEFAKKQPSSENNHTTARLAIWLQLHWQSPSHNLQFSPPVCLPGKPVLKPFHWLSLGKAPPLLPPPQWL